MAQAELHPIFNGLTGRSGGMVFRRMGGKIVIARHTQPRAGTGSAAQQAQRERFALARHYARRVLADPWQRKAYEKLARQRNRRADLLLVSDYLTPPTIDRIDISGYQNQPGGMIRVLADDDIEVVSVEVAIHAASGTVLERGPAEHVHGVWCYRTTADARAESSSTILIRAKDRAGNTTEDALSG